MTVKVNNNTDETKEWLQSLADSNYLQKSVSDRFSSFSFDTSQETLDELQRQQQLKEVETQKKNDKTRQDIRDKIKNFSKKFDMNSNKMIVERVIFEKLKKNNPEEKVVVTRLKNLQNYYSSIFNNILVGVKSIYNVCVELYNAKQNLKDDFDILKEVLPLTETTIAKYLKIGESTLLAELYKLNKLPESWTTQYYITYQVTKNGLNTDDNTREAFIKWCSIYTTQKDIFEYFYGEPQKVSSPWKYEELEKPIDFLRVALESDNRLSGLEPNTLYYIRERVEEVVRDAINEMSYDKLGYSTNEFDQPMKVGVAFNEPLAKGIVTVTHEWMSNKSKELSEKYLTAFKKKFKEITSKTVSSVLPKSTIADVKLTK